MPNLKIALGLAATFTAGIALATPTQARDLAVVSWGGAYQDAQKRFISNRSRRRAALR